MPVIRAVFHQECWPMKPPLFNETDLDSQLNQITTNILNISAVCVQQQQQQQPGIWVLIKKGFTA